MSQHRIDSEVLSIDLPNVGAGPDPLSVTDLAADSPFVVLLLMQSHRSGTCRQQVRDVSENEDEFRRVDATVAAIVPGTRPKVRSWRRLTDPSIPILADDDARIAECVRQPQRYGKLGQLVGSIGRAPTTVVLDCRGGEPTIEYVHEGTTSFDRPSALEVATAIDELRR